MRLQPKLMADFGCWTLKHQNMFNKMTAWKMKLSSQEKWGIDNLLFITRDDDPWNAIQGMLPFDAHNLKSELVKQDVLILTGEEDHFMGMKLQNL